MSIANRLKQGGEKSDIQYVGPHLSRSLEWQSKARSRGVRGGASWILVAGTGPASAMPASEIESEMLT